MTMTSVGASIEAEQISVSYGEREVLRDLSAHTFPGRVLAVTGPSGVGKTTLLWALAGLIRPQKGQVRVNGEPLASHREAIKRGVVLIPQNNGLAATLTASENVHIALIANGISAAEAEARTADALEKLGLTDQADQLVEELSGGQQQRTAVARGIAMRASVLLADEVTSELDALNRERVVELLLAESRRGAAVVFATHDAQAAEQCHAEIHLEGLHH